MKTRLRICYVLESTELCGGVRIVFDQARALAERGHDVSIRARRGDHGWYHYPVAVDYVADLAQPPDGPPLDVAIGTFWTTIGPARSLAARLTVHLCQGHEWAVPEYASMHERIEAVYAQPVAKVTVGEWLTEQIRQRFGRDAFPVETVGQIVDTGLYRAPTWTETLRRMWRRSPFTVLVVGMFESWFKGVPVALQAVAKLRREGVPLSLVRASPTPLSDAERQITRVDSYHERVPPTAMAQLYRSADLLLAPSRSPEGFGLPFVEALASGVPVVATEIPSYLSLHDGKRDYARFVPEGDPDAMAIVAREVLSHGALRYRLSRVGSRVVHQQFSASAVAQRLESFFLRQLAFDDFQ